MPLSGILGLQWKDINFVEKTLNVERTLNYRKIVEKGKTDFYFGTPKSEKSTREIPLLNCVVEKLKAHQMMQNLERQQAGKDYIDNDMVFYNEFGGYVTPNTITKRYKKLLQRHGIRHVKFHGLRHAFATRALEGGMNMKVVQELMGHSTMATTTNVYTHVSLAEKRKAMACLEKTNNIGS